MIYFQIFTTFRYKSLKNSDSFDNSVNNLFSKKVDNFVILQIIDTLAVA